LDWISSFVFFVSTPAPLAPALAKDNHYDTNNTNITNKTFFSTAHTQAAGAAPPLVNMKKMKRRRMRMMMAGHITRNSMYNAGAGILISRPLFDFMIPKFYTSPLCPFLWVNDDTVTQCARNLAHQNGAQDDDDDANFTTNDDLAADTSKTHQNKKNKNKKKEDRMMTIKLIHSNAFSFYPDAIYHVNDFIGQVTVHPVKDFALMQAMTDTVNDFYHHDNDGDKE
jgi:hypothetical protein